MCLFDKEESVILGRDTEEGRQIRKLIKQARQKIRLHETKGIYTMPAWLLPPGKEVKGPGFHRQGA